jgi:hypothetical protein
LVEGEGVGKKFQRRKEGSLVASLCSRNPPDETVVVRRAQWWTKPGHPPGGDTNKLGGSILLREASGGEACKCSYFRIPLVDTCRHRIVACRSFPTTWSPILNSDRGYLFHDSDLGAVLSNQADKLIAEIEGMGSNTLLNANLEDLSSVLAEKHRVSMVKLKETEITIEQNEASIDVSRDPSRLIFNRSGPFYVKGTGVSFFVPFEGDSALFRCQPSTYTMNPPRASIGNSELVLRYERTDHDAEAIRSSFQAELGRIRQYIEWMSGNVSQFNDSLSERARSHIEQRRNKLLKDQGIVSALGFPLRRREGVPQTYTVPTVQRKPPVQRPSNPTPPFKLEPVLELQEYEHILSVISNMVVVMERSPKAFSGMGEEDLRQHFLVQLNGHYEGQATGETFNFDGKTDILIRVDGKNIFIAECKF